MRILITYDVDTTENEGSKRLRNVAKSCLDFGQRVQNSVFECQLTEAQYVILKERIKKIINPDLDSIRIYKLNKNENLGVEVLGKETGYKLNDALII